MDSYSIHMDIAPPAAPLAAAIRHEMRAAGLSVLKVSEETGIPRVTLRRRLVTNRGFTVEEVGAIAELLGTSASSLIATAEALAAETPAA